MVTEPRITILTGHFGSGKTELAINLALKKSREGKKIAICDLDVVNLYYRSRDVFQMLEEAGVELIAPQKSLISADLPVITSDIFRVLHDESYEVIIDVGGEEDGATVLGQFFDQLQNENINMLFVLNVFRPYVSTAPLVKEAIHRIERASRLKVTGIINNPNLGLMTTESDVVIGVKKGEEFASEIGIPLLFSGVWEEIHAIESKEQIMVLKRYMKSPFE